MKNTIAERNQHIADLVNAQLPNGGSYEKWSMARDLFLQYYGDMMATMEANALQNTNMI